MHDSRLRKNMCTRRRETEQIARVQQIEHAIVQIILDIDLHSAPYEY